MKKSLALIAGIALSGILVTSPLLAQPAGQGPGAGPPAAGGPGPGPGPGPGYGPRGGGWGPGMMMGPGMMGMSGFGGMCNPRSAGLAEWRMQRIEQIVKPTDAQKAALTALREASVKAAEGIAAACPAEFPENATARLALMEKRMEAMLTAVKTVRPAFDAFYATLSEEQKARMNTAGPRGWGWRGWR